jgi:hypothetical protein
MNLFIKLFLTSLFLITITPLQASGIVANITALSPNEMIKWGNPKTLPVGAHDYVLHGNPETKSIYTVRLKLPANYKIPPYFQSATSYTTVISGSYHIGMGSKFDETKGKLISKGGFIIIPEKITVYAWTTEPTIIQINGEGPLKVTTLDKENSK